jgi:hypothetical protein
VLTPDDAEVESDPTELFVVDRPVDSELTPLCALLMPLEAEVESDPTLLFVVESPVDTEATPL